MGTACNQCLKSQISQSIEQIYNNSIKHADNRLTKHIKTGYTYENISFFITTQPIYKTQLHIVIMFIDKLQGLVDNPYIRELCTRDKAKIQKRIQQIKDRVKFQKQGDYVNMIDPFEVCKIGTLLVVKVGILGKNQQIVLSQSIENIFQETQRKCLTIQVPSIGVVEVPSILGYSSAKFQTEILNHLNRLFKGRNATFVYFTFTEERLQNFINFLLNPQNSFSLNNMTNNSSYF